MSHHLLKGQRGIIFGALNDMSIAWKVAERAVEEGATITLSNTPIAVRMGQVDALAEKLNAQVIPADATSVEDLETVFAKSVEILGGKIDFVLHSIGMSPNVRKKRTYDDLDYGMLEKTLDISAISFHKMLQVAKMCIRDRFQSSYAAEDSTVPEMGNMEIHQIAQQSSTIKGVVKDQKGEPLIGVSIVVKGTTNGTASDFDGNFTLDVPDNSTLVFSFIGFKSQEVRYTGQKTLNIVLAEDSETLDEVVVVGYGSQKKGEITSSVTSVKASDFNKAPVVNPMQLVEGRVAGLTVSRGSTDPNGEVKVQMRGASSLKGSNEPLVIIDGMPGNMTSLNAIAPEDIEAVSYTHLDV